jgi:hypothetical protein
MQLLVNGEQVILFEIHDRKSLSPELSYKNVVTSTSVYV